MENTEDIKKELKDHVTKDLKDEDKVEEKELNKETIEEDKSNEEIEALKKELEDTKELVKRNAAEFMNYKKRITREKEDYFVFANEKIMTELLSVVDNFDRALASEENKESSFFKGVSLIKKELLDVLTKNGLEEIEAQGKEFDPNFHHAVLSEAAENEEDKNKVSEVLQKGYKLKDKVLRASMVKVIN